MIFLSHTAKDKPIVEQVATKLAKTFGINNIFYDSWSIQPGDGIIDKMNEGLQSCSYFFFFISNNSLQSKMVSLEWQNALMKASKGDMKFIPVKIDNSIVPAILTQSLYIDLYNNGLEVALRQMIDVINKTNTYKPQFNEFYNLHAYLTQENNYSYIVDIKAEYYLEPTSIYCILIDNDLNNVKTTNLSDALIMSGQHENVEINGIKHNAITQSVSRSTTPEYPFSLKIETINKEDLNLVGVMHSANGKTYQLIPAHFINN